ncbi:hypothetical protein J0H58_13045 [bacterium]|nr:hypothetical protein [bacterium]
MLVVVSFLALLACLAAFASLALTDTVTPRGRASQALLAAGVVLCLGLFFAALAGAPADRSDTPSAPAVTRLPPEVSAAERAARVEVSIRWAGRAVGCWVALLAASELLRLVLKRPAGAELLGPAAVFLAGVLLLEPGWAVGLGFVLLVTAAAGLAVWRRSAPREAAEPRAAPDSGLGSVPE